MSALYSHQILAEPNTFWAMPGTRWALAEKERINALELEMSFVIVNIDSCLFWLKLLLANPGDLKPLESFGTVNIVEEKLREVNEKKQRVSSNINHQ